MYREDVIPALNIAGDALRDLGRSGEARDRHARAVALAEALASEHPKVPGYRARLADSLRRLPGSSWTPATPPGPSPTPAGPSGCSRGCPLATA
jgi:hypothetical protein